MRRVSTDRAPAYLPFITQAMVSNGLLYAAAIPRDPQTLDIPARFDDQVRLAFENLTAVLAADGLDLTSLVKVNVYLSDIANWARFNEIYTEFVDAECPPMRVAVEVARLNNDYLVELDIIAEAAR